MATEELVLELKGKTNQFERSMASSTKASDALIKSTNKAKGSISKLTPAAKGVAGGLATMAKGVALAATALTTMVTISAKNEQELATLTDTAGKTREEFESLSFAFKQYGVDAKGTADALNDVSERLGEFAAAGTGPFQDFADVMGINKTEARALAEELQFLSGDEAIQRMYTEMEKANVPAAQMSFVMKSMSNDLEYASALFADQGKELNTLTSRYNRMNEQIGITSQQSEDLKDVATSFDLMQTSFSKASTAISATLAPQFEGFFNAVIEIVPKATNAIIDFINQFKDASEINSIKQLNSQIEESEIQIRKLTNARAGAQNIKDNYWSQGEAEKQSIRIKAINEDIAEQTKRIQELKDKKKELEEDDKRRKVEAEEGGSFSGTGGTGETGGAATGDELQSILDRFKSQEQRLLEQYNKEKLILDKQIEDKTERDAALLDLEREYQESLAEIKQEKRDEEAQGIEDLFKVQARIDADNAKSSEKLIKQREKDNASYLSSARKIGDALFEDNKAVRAGLVVADTAQAAMRAFADLGPIAGPIAAGAIALEGQARLEEINSAQKGGGSIGGGGGASFDSQAANQEQQASITGVSTDVSGNVQSFQLEGNGDELIDAIANALTQRRIDGA